MIQYLRLLLAFAIFSTLLTPSPAQESTGFHKGLCLEGTRPLEVCHIDDIESFGVNCVSLNPFGWMASARDPELRFSAEMNTPPGRRFWGESNAGLLQYAAKADAAGMDVMLRPHIWIRDAYNDDGEFQWLDKVDFGSKEDQDTFAENYRAYALHFARVAELGGMEWYSIGAETTVLSKKYPDYWRGLIAEIREVYSGKLIYSANWYDEVESITFWGDLDAIGVQAYFPLTSSTDRSSLTKEKLIRGWQPHLDKLQKISERYDRPVIFTEVGYKSTSDAALEPWEWKGDGVTDDTLQQICYEATFEAIGGRSFIEGLYWWKYHVYNCDDIEGMPERRIRDFTFQNKPAEETLRSNY